jgi:threonine aldolase
MNHLSRRTFLGTSTALALLGGNSVPAGRAVEATEGTSETVSFVTDGLNLSSTEYSVLLAQLAQQKGAEKDRYLAGGCVAELEARFAKLLGKEQAVFVPTGTLANHLAIRCQAAGKSRVLVQAESHVYCDELDCVQTLSHLNLVPLAPGNATVSLREIEEAYRQARNGPFPLQVGVLSVECPVRRRLGETVDMEELTRISRFAREHDIRMHLDGARLWIASAYTGIAPAQYAALFDTVYVSLYKYFNAGTGAVLAGPRAVVEQVSQAKKMFGGGLYQAWPYAAVALHYLGGFPERFQRATASARALFAQLEEHPRFRLERIANGTNIVKLRVKDLDGAKYNAALKSRGVYINTPPPGSSELVLTINESLNRRPADELARIFVEALAA